MEKRTCTKCNIEKDIKEYGLHKSSGDGIRHWCRDCCKEYKKQYSKNNKEELKERNKQYRENNKEKINEYHKQYRADNQEKRKEYLKDNKELFKEYHKQYCKEHRDIYNMHNQRYNAKKKQLPNTLTVEQWEECKNHFKGECAYCGKTKPLAQDHFIPISKGGEYTINNIIPACKSCNSSKHDKVFEEWYPQQIYYSPKREQNIYKLLNYNKGAQQLIMPL